MISNRRWHNSPLWYALLTVGVIVGIVAAVVLVVCN